MGSLTWNGGPGLWTDPNNWTVVSGTDSVPGAADDVTIGAPLNYVVTVSGAQAAHDITLDGSGAKLSITGTLAVHGTVTAPAGILSVAGGGALVGGLYPASAVQLASGAALDGTAWRGGPDLPASGTVSVRNGLTLLGAAGTGPGTLDVKLGATLLFLDGGTLDNATVTMVGQILGTTRIAVAAGTTLTLGPALTLEVAGGNPTLDGTVINRGLISGLPGDSVQVGSLRNEGSVALAAQASLLPADDMVNNGAITLGQNAFARLPGNLSGTGTFTLGDHASMAVAGTIAAGTHIVRAGSDFKLSIAAVEAGVTIEGFAAGSTLNLTDVANTGNVNAFWSGTPTGGTLTVKDGSTVKATLFLTGIADGAGFSVTADGQAGIDIGTDSPACFAAGTRILTTSGPMAVERLAVGDRLVSAFGGTAELRWIGRRQIVAFRHPRPETVWPIRIRAGALADGVPARDLRVSPDHALYFAGVLVPAGLLVNGHTILREPVAAIRYFHLELPQHDVILAEAAPCEFYLDTGNRSAFENAGQVVAAHPEFAVPSADEIWRSRACASQCRNGPMLAAIRHALALRAGFEFRRRGAA